MTRHVLSDADRAKSRSPEALAKRRETHARHAQWRREDAVALHEYGLVDGAIANEIGVSEETVARWLVGKRVRPKYGRGYIERPS